MLPTPKGYSALVSPGAGAYQFGGSLNGAFNTNPGQYNGNTSYLYNYANTLSWTHGKHAFKFGGEARFTQLKGYNNVAGGGVVFPFPTIQGGAGSNVSSLNTASNTPLLPNTALAGRRETNAVNMLYFLAGSVNNVQQLYWIAGASDVANGTWQDVTTSPNGRKYRNTIQNEFSGFLKDDWKVSQNLTVNLGVRYDYYGSPYIGSGLTSTTSDLGAGLFGVTRGSENLFDNWLRPGSVFLTGYGPAAPSATALSCAMPACDPREDDHHRVRRKGHA